MSADAWLTIAVVLLTLVLLATTRIATDALMVGSLTALLLSGILSPGEALAGLANPGLATVGALYIVVAGLVDTGAIHALGHRLLGRSRSVAVAQMRLMLPVTAMSAFLNNTPLVAMLVPVIDDWCRKTRNAASKFMIPLSYAAILGGTCTLVGTSTNLVVHGLVLSKTDLGPLGFFDIAHVGIPTAVVGILYVLIVGRWLLPDRGGALHEQDNPREYVIEMMIDPRSPIIGRTIEEAGLRHLPGAYLAEIERDDAIIPAVGPNERVRLGDRLVFVGVVGSVIDLVKQKGLVPATNQVFKLDTPRPERRVVEAVVSDTSPIVGRTIREGRFRSRYGAVVIAVARNGERVRGKVGDIEVRPGDTLLIETHPSFVEQQRNSRDFLLIGEISGGAPPRHDRAWIAILILLAMVILAGTEMVSMLEAALAAAAAMIVMRCTTVASARASVDWSVLTVIGASIGIGSAMETTGAAQAIAHAGLGWIGDRPAFALAVVYLLTMLFTEVISNNAAAVLMFPIAIAASTRLDVSPWPFIIAIMMAASASFATPIGYQTNLMVYGPGGYRFTDYVRFGLPLNLLLAAVAITIIPLAWPFRG